MEVFYKIFNTKRKAQRNPLSLKSGVGENRTHNSLLARQTRYP